MFVLSDILAGGCCMCGTFHIINHILQSWSNPPDDMFSKLPEKIIYLILIKLPAKDLVELMRVSKLFHSLISQPYFLDLHLSTLSNQNQNSHLSAQRKFFGLIKLNLNVLHLSMMPNQKQDLHSSTLPNQKQYLSMGSVIFFHKKLNYLVHHDDSGSIINLSRICHDIDFKVVGSTRGLVCLIKWHPICQSFSLRLWNPLIGKLKEIPALPDFQNRKNILRLKDTMGNRWKDTMGDQYTVGFIIGFVFYHVKVDFKLVVISYEQSQSTHKGLYGAKICVYSHKRNSWSNVRCIKLPCYVRGTYKGYTPTQMFSEKHVSVGGIAYWMAQKEKGKKEDCILGIDVVNNVYEVLELPKDIGMSTYAAESLRLFSLVDESTLALFLSNEGTYTGFQSKKWSIWVMNNAGFSSKPRSWEKRYNLELGVAVYPTALVDDTHFLAMKVVKEADDPHPQCVPGTIGYIPSLALLDTNT